MIHQRRLEQCPHVEGRLQIGDPHKPDFRETLELDTNLCFSHHGYICGICIRACPYEGVALKAGQWEAPVLDPDACVGCGLCEQACVHMPQALRVRPERV